VLAQTIRQTKNLHLALQAYNGCVHGKNTPGCHTYTSKVIKARNLTESQMLAVSPTP